MSNEQKRPQVGDVVWSRGVVIEVIDGGTWPFLVEWTHEDHSKISAAAIHHIGDHPPRLKHKPWDTLREAAAIMWQRDCFEAARILRKEADRIERAAAPPDPVDVLQEVQASVFMPGLPPQLRERISAAIAAHDAKKNHTNG